MGAFLSSSISFITAEQHTWLEHDIKYDHGARARMVADLDKFRVGETLRLGYVDREFHGVPFQHWFVANDHWVFEFGSPSLSIYDARVEVSSHVPSPFVVKGEEAMTALIRQRMSHVLGMKNYSLCFRNCEHVANYVFRGRWVSTQMDDMTADGSTAGLLSRRFRNYLLDKHKRMLNSFPTTLRASFADAISAEKLYAFLPERRSFTSVEYYLDEAEGTMNYLVIGPMGAGKSRLINVFFNARVCDEGESLDAMTKEITFIRGESAMEFVEGVGAAQRVTRRRNKIVLIDTVGLCDTEWSEEDLHRLIKNRVSSNTPQVHGVLVLLPATERLNPHVKASLRALLDWLQFDIHRSLFNFVLTKADRLQGSEEEIAADKERLKTQLAAAFGILPVPRRRGEELPIYFTAFPKVVAPERHEEFVRMYDDAFSAVTNTIPGHPVTTRPDASCTVM